MPRQPETVVGEHAIYIYEYRGIWSTVANIKLLTLMLLVCEENINTVIAWWRDENCLRKTSSHLNTMRTRKRNKTPSSVSLAKGLSHDPKEEHSLK